MNHIYRLVWNRAKRVMQVVSELAGGGGGATPGRRRMPRRNALSEACAFLLAIGAIGTAPAQAAICVPDATHICGINGNAGSDPTPGAAGTAGAGSNPGVNDGGAGGYDQGVGSAGGAQSDNGGSNGHGGGGGDLANGGLGGGGGGGNSNFSGYGGGGGGGGGGLGLLLTGSYGLNGTVTGGNGGAASTGLTNFAAGGSSSGAGGGGAGILLDIGGFGLLNMGSIFGGDGGGLAWAGAGEVGSGGNAVLIAAGGALSNSGTIRGGNAGQTSSATAGFGGDGVEAASGASVLNDTAGTIEGGTGNATGGDGLRAHGTLAFSNNGTFRGGAGADHSDAFADGGAGGTGLRVEAGAGSSGSNAGTIAGGHGGHGGDGTTGDGFRGRVGGAGGAGADVTAYDFTNNGVLQGGAGGDGGRGSTSIFDNTPSGAGGAGGAGLVAHQAVVRNAGTLQGGQGGVRGTSGTSLGAQGAGGAGAVIADGTILINSGTISGGMNGDGATRAAAIRFSGTGSGLMLDAGSSIVGEVVLDAGVEATISSVNSDATLNDGIALGNGSALTLDTGAADMNVLAGISGAGALTTSGVNLLVLHAVDVASLQSVAGALALAGNITTSGSQLYYGDTEIWSNVVLASTGNGSIAFDGEVLGADFSLTVETGGAVYFGDAVSLGNLSVTSTAAIAQGAAFTVGGTASFDAGASGITLANAANDFAGLVNLAGGNAAVYDANALRLGTLALSGDLMADSAGPTDLGQGGIAGDLVARSGGPITQSGALSVGADTSLQTLGGDISLTNADNDFSGPVAAFGGNIAIVDVNDLSATDIFALGHVDLAAAGILTVASRNMGSGISAHGVSLSGGMGIALSGAIMSSAEQVFDGPVVLNGDTLLIGRGNAGAIVDRVQFLDSVDGAHGLDVSTNGNVGFGDIGTTTALAGLSASGFSFAAGEMHVDGALSVTTTGSGAGAGIFQNAAWSVAGDALLRAGAGGVFLLVSGNDFQGAVDVAGGSILIHDDNDLDIAALANATNGEITLAAGGVLTLPTGNIDTGTSNLLLASGGAFATPGALSGWNVQLSANGLVIGDDVSGESVVLSGGSGSIVQTGGSIVANALGGSIATSGDIRLESAGNNIGMLGGFEAGSFSLVNGSVMLIDGHSTIAGDMRLQGPLFMLDGSIDAGRTILGPNTFLGIGIGTTAGTLTGDLDIGTGSGAAFRHSDDVNYAGAISGSGHLYQQGSGTLVLDGDSSAFAGATNVDSGKLIVGSVAGNGAALGGDVAVSGLATIGGHGTIGGDVFVGPGGHLAPGNSIGTLTIGGDLVLGHGVVLDYEFGAPGASFSTPGTSDRVDVGGDVAIDGGFLDVTDAGGMGAGLYTVLTWGGALAQSNGGLSLGTVPAGQDLQLQVLGDRINVLDTAGLTLNFWNANGAATVAQLGGGSGTWSATAPNWTDADANATSAMSPQPGFAIFGGAAGTVAVDGDTGAVAASGLQFASDGYRLTGDTLTLVGDGTGAPVIRVGDGSAAGAVMTATIGNVIAGSDGLRKADAGTLVLAGTNTYSGGTTISGGTLQVSSDSNLGAAGEGVILDGGTLAMTAFFAAARDIVVGSTGGGLRADAGAAFDGAITGAGTLHTAGTITLTNAGNAFGGASIDAGTLALRGAGTAPGTMAVAGGAVFDISESDAGASVAGLSGAGHVALGGQALTFDGGTSTFGGTLADGGIGGGTGGRLLLGSGLLTLTGANTYTGATTITGGATLALAGTGSIVGSAALQVDGTFAIDGTAAGASIRDLRGAGTVDLGARTLTVTAANGSFGGSFAGAGGLSVDGGTLTLDGASSYTGATTIGNGATLALAGTGSIAGSIQVVVDGTFDIAGTTAGATVAALAGAGDVVLGDQALAIAGSGSFAGDITGTGSLHQLGGGTQVLLGNLLYTGNTTLDAGATLAFGRSDTFAFGSAISGNGTLRQQGGGVLVLAGDSAAFAGDTQVTAGRLVVGGSAGSAAVLGGDVSVAAGAFLGGHGRIGGDVLNAGTVAPGNSIGVLTIGGDYSQLATGTLQIEAEADGQADRLVVEGSAALDGSMLVLAADGDWRPQTDYTILTAGEGVSGHFGSATSSLVFLDPLLAYGNNAVTLTLRRNDIDFASVATTPNQAGVADAADALGWGNPVYTALTTLDAAHAAAAFDALSGEIHAATRGALLDDSRHLEQTVVLQSASTPIDARGAWVAGWGHWGRFDGDGNAAGLDTDGSGIAIGGGVPLGDHARIGAVIGTGKLGVRSDARASRSDVDSRHAGLHVRLDTPVASLQAGVLRSWHDIDSDRAVAFAGYQDSLQADADADTTQFFIDASRVFDLGDVQLVPFADIARVKLHGDAFDETGGAAALHVDAGDVTRTLARVGLHGEWRANDSTHLWASVGWMHASGDDRVAGQQRFADGATPFTTTGAALADSTALLDAGLRWQPGARTTLEAAYNGRFGDGLRDQGARISLRWAF
jgi:fibronectin-binding autotransporter adhesin